jgi:DNA-binding transcriptional ArsR family regulator
MILCQLTGVERSVGELEKLLKLAQPAVSQQLARLRLDNLVQARRDGRTIYYTASEERVRSILRDVCHLLGYSLAPGAAAARPADDGTPGGDDPAVDPPHSFAV